MPSDLIIIGAGPAGLSMARALSGHGLSIQVFARATRDRLTNPADYGREIALTHRRARPLTRQLLAGLAPRWL